MKVRKNKKLKTYSAKELIEISNEANKEEYLFQCFRNLVWKEIYNAAINGCYSIDISVSDYSDNFISKIQEELLANNLESYVLQDTNIMYGFTKIKILTVKWYINKGF